MFELLVELFNFSDAAYMKKSNDVKSQMADRFTNEKGYSLQLEIFNEVNETYALVFTSEHQIIVAFKGTTTIENMKTDLKVKMENISKAIPLREGSSHKILSSLDWKNAKIHKGFAKAYASVRDELLVKVGMLYAEKKKPIYFTGHSLGASLATIASLDVAVSLGIEDLYVLTFGSPRCGNMFWSRVCDQIVEAHWRCAIRSDIVTTLPRAGYSHTGKRVAITTSGEIFLDPNAIEIVLWSSAGVNATDHGKPAYKKAITLFASKYLPGFSTEFITADGEEGVSESIKTANFSSKRGVETYTDNFSLGPGTHWK